MQQTKMLLHLNRHMLQLRLR